MIFVRCKAYYSLVSTTAHSHSYVAAGVMSTEHIQHSSVCPCRAVSGSCFAPQGDGGASLFWDGMVLEQ